MTSPRSEPASPPAGQSSSPSASRPRQQRIRFPGDPDNASKQAQAGSSAVNGENGASVKPGEPRYLLPSPYASGYEATRDFKSERRRVRSATAVDSPTSRASPGRSQLPAEVTRLRSHQKRRTISHSAQGSDAIKKAANANASLESSTYVDGSFGRSEEDAPDDDDPKVLAELQKALQYRTKVEEQLKAVKSNTELSSVSHGIHSTSSPSNYSSNPFLPKPADEHGTSRQEDFVDFSPSVGKTPLHPVPTSANDGATLDWSGFASEEDRRERKWSISLTRRASKEHSPTLVRKVVVEKQESLYSDKVARIRQKANPQTLRKAQITADQLSRRYAVLNASFSPGAHPLNLGSAVRWFAEQDAGTQHLMDETEPMFWLRHLLRKRGDTDAPRTRSPWHLSALVVDEYARATSDQLSQSRSAGDLLSETDSLVSHARPASFRSLDISSIRKSDDLISFEPQVASASRRNSAGADAESRKSLSLESSVRRWRNSLPGMVDSPRSSLHVKDGSPESHAHAAPRDGSPSSRRSPLRAFKKRHHQHAHEQRSDDEHSSAVESSDGRRPPEETANPRERKRSRFHFSLDLKSAQGAGAGVGQGGSGGSAEEANQRTPMPFDINELRTDRSELAPAKSASLPVEVEADGAALIDARVQPKRLLSQQHVSGSHMSQSQAQSVSQQAQQLRAIPARRVRASLPSSLNPGSLKLGKSAPKTDVQEHAQAIEYARKKELLDALRARNARMKVLLQTASRTIAEYDETQNAMAEKLGLSYTRLPPEVLDCLSHDPSRVTGNTTKSKSYVAVEDIFARHQQQTNTLQAFVAALPTAVQPCALPERGIYDEATEKLAGLVDRLHAERSVVLARVRHTSELLARVKKLRDQLKPEYDAAGRHTSANYPELVRLESLLDSLVHTRNRLWRLGETTLSFFLGFLAPFMKTFGRPIWNELHDFLIIPLYRNDFSGEETWYPLTFPRRSFLHWLRLIALAFIIPIMLVGGIRFFVSLLTEGYFVRIPSYIPWFAVYVLYSGIMSSIASTLLFLLIIALCELVIIVWWIAWLLHVVI